MIISEMSVASFVVDMQETMADLHDKITWYSEELP